MATRVRPPGTTLAPRAPLSTKGRRSTWRGLIPPAVAVGQVVNASGGCAMHFYGACFNFAENLSICGLVACGPTSMPYPPEPLTSLTTSSDRWSST